MPEDLMLLPHWKLLLMLSYLVGYNEYPVSWSYRHISCQVQWCWNDSHEVCRLPLICHLLYWAQNSKQYIECQNKGEDFFLGNWNMSVYFNELLSSDATVWALDKIAACCLTAPKPLTSKDLQTHGCILSTVVIDAPVQRTMPSVSTLLINNHFIEPVSYQNNTIRVNKIRKLDNILKKFSVV